MGGGKGGGGNNVVKTEPWGHEKPYLKRGMADAQVLYDQGMPSPYPGAMSVARDPLEVIAQQGRYNYATNNLTPMIDAMQKANYSMLQAPDVGSNPYVGGMLQSLGRRMGTSFNEDILPGVKHQMIKAGQFGMDSDAIARSKAAGKAMDAYGNAASQIMGQAYGQGLEQQARGMLAAPQSMQAGFMPYDTVEQTGAMIRGDMEKILQQDIDRYNVTARNPYENINFLQSAAGSGGQYNTQKTESPGGSPLAGAIGGGLLGYAASNLAAPSFMLTPGAAATGLTLGGALGMWPMIAGGALLGGLLS